MNIRDDQVLQEIAEVLKAMGEPTRLRLLQELLPGERAAGELVEAVGTSQANVSKHLSRLRRAGLVASRRDGSRVLFHITAPFVRDVCAVLCRGLEHRLDEQGVLRRKVRRILRGTAEG